MNKFNRKRILLVRLDRIGDVLLSTPVIKAVRDACPDSYIAFMVAPQSADVVEGNPYLDEVIVYDKNSSSKNILGKGRIVSLLRKKKFDLALALHPTARTHIILKMAGIPQTIGYSRKYGFLLKKKLPHTKQFGLKHEIDYALDLVRAIGIEPKDKALYMPVNEKAEYAVTNMFKQHGIMPDDVCIGINPGASCVSKRWNVKKFAQAARAIAARHNAKIVIVAGPTDKEIGDQVASLLHNECLNLSGRTSVSQLASVLRRLRLFISNDSGPVHIASAVGTPVISIFGRNDRGLSPKRWGPVGKNDIVIHKKSLCEQCLAHDCDKGFMCLEAVTVEDVSHAADKILGV